MVDPKKEDAAYASADSLNQVQELSASEALFGFTAWLTTHKEVTVMSAAHDCVPIIDLIQAFCTANNLAEPAGDWVARLVHPPSREVT